MSTTVTSVDTLNGTADDGYVYPDDLPPIDWQGLFDSGFSDGTDYSYSADYDYYEFPDPLDDQNTVTGPPPPVLPPVVENYDYYYDYEPPPMPPVLDTSIPDDYSGGTDAAEGSLEIGPNFDLSSFFGGGGGGDVEAPTAAAPSPPRCVYHSLKSWFESACQTIGSALYCLKWESTINYIFASPCRLFRHRSDTILKPL